MTPRRSFLVRVGQGMLAAGLGHSTAVQLGLAAMPIEDKPSRLRFAGHDRLVDLLQETPLEKFLPAVVSELRSGTSLQQLITAAALANARAFGGEDYVGFHTFMALMPALRMSRQLPAELQPLPILKVLYRQAARLEETDHHHSDTLKPAASVTASQDLTQLTQAITNSVHQQDRNTADQLLTSATHASSETAWNSLLPTVFEAPEVHRIVLAHRAWDMLDLVGQSHADAMLRQSLHYCIHVEHNRQKGYHNISEKLAAMIEDSFAAISASTPSRVADEQWIVQFSELLLKTPPEAAAAAAAAALAEGISPASVSQAVSATACQLVLRDAGRPPEWAQPNKPVGSVHGDSIGVHASDTAHAWRQIASVSNPKNTRAAVILSAWCVARDAAVRPASEWTPRPLEQSLQQISETDPQRLQAILESSIRQQQQDLACAAASRCLTAGVSAETLFLKLLPFACSEDGALHAEKYFWTTRDEFTSLPAGLRNHELIALARVSASQYGTPAPGLQEARDLLKIAGQS